MAAADDHLRSPVASDGPPTNPRDASTSPGAASRDGHRPIRGESNPDEDASQASPVAPARTEVAIPVGLRAAELGGRDGEGGNARGGRKRQAPCGAGPTVGNPSRGTIHDCQAGTTHARGCLHATGEADRRRRGDGGDSDRAGVRLTFRGGGPRADAIRFRLAGCRIRGVHVSPVTSSSRARLSTARSAAARRASRLGGDLVVGGLDCPAKRVQVPSQGSGNAARRGRPRVCAATEVPGQLRLRDSSAGLDRCLGEPEVLQPFFDCRRHGATITAA